MATFIRAVLIASLAIVLVGTALAGGGKVPALEMSGGSSAAMHNAEGIEHYNQGHWEIAYEHFLEAMKADKNAAEAHYNVALTLDKMGQHGDAAKHFKHAQDLGKNNPDIQNSAILKAHVKMLK